jgi:signal transduction histidine kinase
VEATFVLARPDLPPRHLSWHVAPLVGSDREVQGVLATLSVAPPEPDWHELASLAHDLRTPLQSLRLLIPALEATPLLSPDAVEALERLRSASDRALAIGMDLLEWARGPTQASRPLSRDWVPLGPFLKALAGEQLPVAQRKHITMIVDLAAAQNLQVQTDRVRLARLLANLLSNAVRYTSSGEVRFTASWREEGGRRTALALTVADTGAGISAEDQESIFQPFERGKAGKESDSGGSGLGLAVVDRLVQELGLTLEVFSEYGHGSSFDLLLPAESVQPVPAGPDTPPPGRAP